MQKSVQGDAATLLCCFPGMMGLWAIQRISMIKCVIDLRLLFCSLASFPWSEGLFQEQEVVSRLYRDVASQKGGPSIISFAHQDIKDDSCLIGSIRSPSES